MGVRPVAWGFLGTAKISDLVLEGARLSDRVAVVAVASRDRGRAERYAREKGFERAYGSYGELLADDDIEAIYIPLPNSLHVEWSIKALDAGKHVLCEKPLTRRPTEVDEAFEAAERADRFLMEAFMWRHTPQAKRLRELVEDGAIGELRHIRSAFSFPLGELGNVRMRPELDGGSLMDVGCYCVSGSRLLAGEPEIASGTQLLGVTGVDVRFAGWLRFAGDVLATIDCAFDLHNRDELEAIGSEGSLFVDDPWHARRTVIELRRDDGAEEIQVEQVNPYKLELENLSDAIRGEGEPLLGREDALGQARTIEALYRSAGDNAPVTLA